MRWAVSAALLLTVLLSGCAAIPLGLDALVGGVSIYQRYQDRRAQIEQTAEIKLLREEIVRLRGALK